MNRIDSISTPLGAVLVIGGCGLLGRHVVNYLLENGTSPKDITVFDISTKNNRFADVTYISGDLGSKSELSSAFDQSQPNVIMNVASPDAMTPGTEIFERCNILGVQNIIECAQEHGVRILVHTSSSEVIQSSYRDLIWAKEDWPMPESPVDGSIYAKTKSIGEGIVLKANRQKGLFTTAIRLTTMFGEGDVVLTRHSIELGRSGSIKYQVGAGKNFYDFIYAGNAAEGHVLAAQALLRAAHSTTPIPESERVDGEAFNLSNGKPWPFWAVARYISTTAGYPIAEKDVWKIPMGVACFFMAIWEWLFWAGTWGGTPPITRRMLRYTAQIRTFDITKARERLGFEPRVSMEEGLRRGVEWNLAREAELKKAN
ncbi:putative sterol-4-alpha-carboxylate 3-dehydrogenase, decarboxylating [Melanomma pulvis-pyrius CBS 109.77]|uniref:Putative sterol-4-alpha-carboxylate 3-dehydrogenase, decarboxylating n=1 Tax=Melanomma pulvis-pyrius CBS 109.77 TaxID=1314802 RepID=A0A6A6X7Y5_9PLEO|nr:putative sterol-4-alpha-carboxylate 3-dehydrogenase, decarboxylating [Melanomma pulvis-pyrius CBS 109.77]